MGFDREQLHRIRVASPCAEPWDRMTGDDHVRHCARCDKQVYDLSTMALEDIASLVERKEGRVCVRFFRRADGTVLTDDCPEGLAAVRHRLAVAAGVLAYVAAIVAANLSSVMAWFRGRPPIPAVAQYQAPPARRPPLPPQPQLPASEPAEPPPADIEELPSAPTRPVIDPFKGLCEVKGGLAPMTPPPITAKKK